MVSGFVTVVPNSALSSAHGLVPAGPRADAPRREVEPFVLPRDDRTPPRPASERKQAGTPEAQPAKPAKTDAQPASGSGEPGKPSGDDTSTATSATPEDMTTATLLVSLQENEPASGAPDGFETADGERASGEAEAVVADAAPMAAQQDQNEATIQTAPGTVVDAAASPLTTADIVSAAMVTAAQATTTPQTVDATPLLAAGVDSGTGGYRVTAGASGTTLPMPEGALAGTGDSQHGQAAKTGNSPAMSAAASFAASSQPIANETLPATASPDAKQAAETKADQNAAAAGAAKNELVARLEQSFGQPPVRSADIAPPPLPLQSPPPELPRALPPSAVPMEIGLRSLQGLKEFQIRLDPAELGRVEVRLEIGEDKSVSARVVVDRVETLHLLQREAKTLERAFEQAGLKSSDASIDITLRDPGQQGGQGRRDDRSEPSEKGMRDGRAGKAPAIDMSAIPIRRTLHVGALDRSI